MGTGPLKPLILLGPSTRIASTAWCLSYGLDVQWQAPTSPNNPSRRVTSNTDFKMIRKHTFTFLTALLLAPLAAPAFAEVALPATGTVLHLRIHPSGGVTQIRDSELKTTANP